ncbi:cell wall elongation regulator TseB-like domain-containing protein [Cohnella abietis]|uniref:Cell wall elongation regulator TseB-like domain-containing protein n=1 Tax=Cohnella abietis TaxID=2507935 RepID=A0A3T1D556_9BACL|nr:DUF5590 domain-containing protein [Cohnella abietis]BBI33243.1 hypothetical protein KCTCHS21_26420 [Cohnella abietis]
MNLSRSEGKRRLPSLSLRRWLVILAGFVVFVIVTFVLYVRSADTDHRNAENNAIRIAKEQAGLVEVSNAVIHTWDETVWVVNGKDAEEQEWMVWEREAETIKEKVSDNMSEQQMIAKFSQEHNGLMPIRIIPGWFQNGPVWEIRYWNEAEQNNQRHQSIDFYSFKTGSKLKTYVLSS